MSRTRATAVISDVHVPEHDLTLWGNFLQWCRDEKPERLVINGDFGELASCSSHGGVVNPPLFKEDVRDVRLALRQLKSACPSDCEFWYLEGNHETRLKRKITKDAPALSGSISLPEKLDLPGMGIRWKRYGDPLRVGNHLFVHGKWCNQNHVKKHYEAYGRPVSYGHTHKPQMLIRGLPDGDYDVSIGLPCMRTLNPEWTEDGPNGWVQGFGVYYFTQTAVFPYIVLANGGSFVWGGKVYGRGARNEKDQAKVGR